MQVEKLNISAQSNGSQFMSSTHQRITANILCCICGISFNPSETKTSMCIQCVTSQQDITTGITKQGIINFCRMCHRYNKPPWVYCERESKEMLALCLKKIIGINKLKLIDSAFLYTEPHSRRIRLRLTVQKEVLNNTSIQQNFIAEFVEHYGQCDDCKKEFTPHTWGACVQLRQKVEHKKTFYFLEQIILKNNAHDKILKVEEKDDGLDFFYKNKMQANRMVDFLASVIPLKITASKQLISHDDRNNTFVNKYVWALEIPKVCKDDLCIFPPKLCKELGGISPLCICTKVSNMLHFVDTHQHKRIDLNAEKYFHYENDITCISLKNNQTQFMVINYEKIESNGEKMNNSYVSSIQNVYLDKLAHVTVQRTSDWKEFTIRSHLGEILKEGSFVAGYDLTTINYSEDLDVLKNAPDVVLVKKTFDKQATRRGPRIWKLKRMQMDGIMVDEEDENENTKKNKKKVKNDDFEEFMDDIEKDPKLRENINLYKDEDNIKKLSEKELAKKAQLPKKPQRKIAKLINIKLKNPQEILELQKQENEENLKKGQERKINKQKEEEEKNKQQQDEEEDEDYYDNEVKLIELLDGLNFEEKPQEQVQEVNDDNFIDEFIRKLDNVKVEK
ncbi:hypothetical protein IMG5_136460 [Ichthyophthirius multifiliis]|uniref:60S ribosomal export protein NMD3 n=1 Tax=Ichthyophthirius multifiliis TaxID=5932 RepID=G0QWY4_ICHMU|nr:hypothetical protein IMG5_136460 [Ichthyophthirius multifiliis]EGR30265.1 hypothetical protein IMG5_136460 [Ichthyophthirius multifiliis]|eukprot:XP_004065511.1 hypothetical protein IMG5_136460 [Ichthyophthirius multifiliis]